MNVPDLPHSQMEDAHFYMICDDYSQLWPIDDHAIYGWLNLGERGDEEFEIPHRNALREPQTVISALQVGDRVRVNDKNWMVVVDHHFGDPVVRYVHGNGEVLYELWSYYTPERYGVEAGPRMFRQDGHSSAGHISCIEVDWEKRSREDYSVTVNRT